MGLRFKFYTDWDQFWQSLLPVETPSVHEKIPVLYDRNSDKAIGGNYQMIQLTKERTSSSEHVYVYQPVKRMLECIKAQIKVSDFLMTSSGLNIRWLLAPRLGSNAIKQIETQLLNAIALNPKVVVVNLSPWKIPSYVCREETQLYVSDYLLAHKSFTEFSNRQNVEWPLYITKYRHPMDLLCATEDVLESLENECREKGANQMVIISCLNSAELMKWLAVQSSHVTIVNESYADEVDRELYTKWISFYHPDIQFVEKLEGVLS